MMFNSLKLPSTRVPRRRREWPSGATCVRTKFGQDVLWHPRENGGHHLSEEDLEPYRQIGDPLLDEILERLDRENIPLRPGDDLVALAEEASQNSSSESCTSQQLLVSFLRTYMTLPSWVDKEQLERGQNVFLKYAPAISLSLYYRSLVAGFSIPKIAAVIRSTGYLAPPSPPEQVMQRLFDTGQMVASCVALGIDELLPGGKGWRAALHVRALHAKVRRGLLTRSSHKWDTATLGVPINQEDMAGTLLAFSVNALLGIEFVLGRPIPRQERLDYLALWRYIGWLLGVETHAPGRPSLDPCGPGHVNADPIEHSYSILQSIVFHLLDPDESSVEVAHHLLKIRRKKSTDSKTTSLQDSSVNKWFYFRALQCRRFVGNPLADALRLPLHPHLPTRVWLWMASTIYLVLLRMYVVAIMIIPSVRRKCMRFHKNSMQRTNMNWQGTHQSRMARALRRGTKPGISDNDDCKEDKTKVEVCCPFAMVAPPTIDANKATPYPVNITSSSANLRTEEAAIETKIT